MSNKYKIIIVDDHKLFREGVAFVISQTNDFMVSGEASNGKEFLDLIEEVKADIVLMDVCMPLIDGVAATVTALAKFPYLKIIALTMSSDREYFNKMVQAGVSAFLLKESGKEELLKALRTVVSGEKYFSHNLLHKIILNAGPHPGIPDFKESKQIKLTLRELEILKYICQGYSNVQISEKLLMSIRSIESYRSGMMVKTGTKNSVSLAVYALKNNLVDH